MANSSFYGYSYFSGANVFVRLNGMPALETAGITYSVQESTAPIYGYSSRIFDAVAMGQKIIRGSFVINFISPNYVARLIEAGRVSVQRDAVREEFYKNYQRDETTLNQIAGQQATNLEELEQINKELALLQEQLSLDLDEAGKSWAKEIKELEAQAKFNKEYIAEVNRAIPGFYNASFAGFDTAEEYLARPELQAAARDSSTYGGSNVQHRIDAAIEDYQEHLRKQRAMRTSVRGEAHSGGTHPGAYVSIIETHDPAYPDEYLNPVGTSAQDAHNYLRKHVMGNQFRDMKEMEAGIVSYNESIERQKEMAQFRYDSAKFVIDKRLNANQSRKAELEKEYAA